MNFRKGAFVCLIFTTLITSCKKEPAITMTAELEFKSRALLGEGAFWNHESQELFWVDILGKSVNIYNPKNKSNRSFPLPFRVGTVVPQTDSTAVVALENGIYILNLNNRLLTNLSNVEEDIPTNRFNDGKCDPNGNLWVGSMQLDETLPEASLYKVAPDGTTWKMRDNITISNGIVWTKNGRTMYYIDTPTAKIRAYDFNMESSTISNERTVVEVAPEVGYPDGMAIDEEDMLWVGLWNGNAVARFNPKNGELIQKIEVPAHNVTA
ncbi:MAG: SMP-30/gluconolactonase/LRE family protein, partial [Flavobacteriaceae bacterium]|nr:SMP-30/gluconolactonase/LRE family protein [Flavobacteriaceae bacterium]